MKMKKLIKKEKQTVKKYDAKTKAYINEMFQMVARECVEHCVYDLEIEIDESIEFTLYNTKEYAEFLELTFGYKPDREDLLTYGTSYTIPDGKKVVMHGHEYNVGMMKWLEEFEWFEKMVNNLMGLAAGDGQTKYVFRDKDFAKELFDMVQNRVKKHNAA